MLFYELGKIIEYSSLNSQCEIWKEVRPQCSIKVKYQLNAKLMNVIGYV